MNIKKVGLALGIAISFSSLALAIQTNPNVNGVKWYHDSAEKKALYHQAFNIATKEIKHKVKKQKLKKDSWGVILDIDETVLDNSWTEYENYKDFEFDESAYLEEKATATPGAVRFTHFIHDLGGYVSLVTNRPGSDKKEFDATVNNLKKENIYYDQVLFSNEEEKDHYNKNPRFNAVKSGEYSKNIIFTNKLPAHKVIAYFGDNIQDFPELKQKDMQKQGYQAYEKFGSEYFIMPNPLYGSWM